MTIPVGDNTATTKGQNDIKYDANTPIKFGNKTNVTFKNVNVDGNGQFGQTGGNSANLKLSGNNNITITHKGGNAALLVESAEVTDGTTVINHSDSDKNVQYNAGIFIDSTNNGGNVYVDNGASLTINGLTSNAMGIFFDGADNKGTIDSTRTGLIKVSPNAVLNINLKDGNSAAIYADDIDVLKGGTVDITTAQNTTSNGTGTMNGVAISGGLGGIHNSVVNLGMHGTKSRTLRIAQDATFKINRTSNKSSSALLGFGGVGSDGGCTSSVLVNGGTLDLQDYATIYRIWNDGAIKNIPWTGLITMWGSGATDNVDFEAPQLINLQRYGKSQSENGHTQGNTGSMLRLEGTDVNVDINKNISNVVTPLKLWDPQSTNASNEWYIIKEHNQNSWGNKSSGFLKTGTTQENLDKLFAPNGVSTFLKSNGSVTLSKDATGKTVATFNNGTGDTSESYMNSFLNDFNWWSPQRISLSSHSIQVITDEYAPEGGTITVNNGHQLTPNDAENAITNKNTLVDDNGTSVVATDNGYTWTTAPDTTIPGTKAGVVKVTYTDGSSDEVPVTVNVLSQADQYDPQGQDIKTNVGTTPSAESGISNASTLPQGTTYTWAKEPDVSKVGTVPGVVKVTYPDKSVDEVPVNVIVGQPTTPTTQTDADKNDPQGQDITTTLGTVPAAQSGISNTSELPAGTTYTWSQTPNVYSKGSHPGVIQVNYPDGSKDYVPVNVTVTNEPTGKEITVPKGGTVPDAGTTIDWGNGTEPTGTTTTWETEPDVSKPGDTQGTVKITYPDGETTTVVVPVHVTDPSTTTAFDPYGKTISVPYGHTLTDGDAKSAIAGGVPTNATDVTYTWASTPKTSGTNVANTTQQGYVKVTATVDGKQVSKNVLVYVRVGDQADNYNPKGKDITVDKGAKVPTAESGISNTDTLPEGTKYTWAIGPDTNTVGTQNDLVKVTYPDGSFDYVPVNVTVKDNQTDADKYQPSYSPVAVNQGQTATATPTWSTNNDNKGKPADGDATFASTTDTPSWTTVAADGTVTLKPGTDVEVGPHSVPVNVTYKDGSSEIVYVPVAVNGNGDVTIIDDQGHNISIHTAPVISHKTSDTNIIGQPVVQSFKFSYYQGGQNYSKPYIYTLNADKTAYVLSQTGDNPAGVTVNAPESVSVSDIKVSWVPAGTTLFGDVKGNGQPTSVAGADNGGTETIKYTGNDNAQANGYPKYVAVVDSSSVNWPIFGKGPAAMNPFPSVYIYGAKANGTIPSVNSDTTDVKKDLGDAKNYVDTTDLTSANNASVKSVEWQTTPDLSEANAKAPATVRINFTDGSHLDIPVSVNVIKVDQGVDNTKDDTIYRDITRTITIEGQDKPVVQHVIYTRAKVTNLSKPAGSQVTYTDWVAAKDKDGNTVTNFPQLEVTKLGYTASATGATIETKDGKQYVPASDTIGPDSQKETVNVTYIANAHTQVINYVDGNGKVVGTYNVPGKTGETVNVDVPGHVPTNWTLVPGQKYASSVTFGSDNPQPLTYTIEHKTVPVDKNNKDTYREVTQTIEKIPAGETKATIVRTITVPFQRTGTRDLVTNKITWNAWQGPEGSVDKDSKSTYTIKALDVPQVKGYDSYVNGTKTTQVAVEDVTADSANSTYTITYVKQDSTPVPYKPGKDGVNDDMNKYVTRTIAVNNPDGTVTVPQTVHFSREDANGNAGYKDAVSGETTWNAWHVAGDLNATTGKWAEYDAPEVEGYTANPVSVAKKTVTPDTPNAAATINYTKVTNPTDADKYTPEGQDVTTKVGVVPDAEKGISNTKTLPEGTTYTWKETPDVTTAGDKPATVVVTYPDGSKDEVPVTVHVTNPSTPTNPTDADKYTPEGQDVTTKVGVVPDAEKGISNTKTLPEGTTYTWKETPDVTTAGDKPATVVVTYPDGSKDEVPVTVHVTNPTTPTTPTDADKYTPQGQNTQNATVVTNGVSTTSENNTKKANTLPQTGNKQNSAAIAGLALTGFAAMFGLGGSKKKEK